jgi:hypothetical protein
LPKKPAAQDAEKRPYARHHQEFQEFAGLYFAIPMSANL